MENTVTIPITLPAPVFWGVITLIGVSVASYLVFLSLPDTKKADGPLNALKTRLGMENVHAVPFLVGATLWAGIALALILGLFGLIIDILGAVVPDRDETPDVWEFRFKLVQLTALTTVLAAVVALPLTAIRLRLTRQQTLTANEALFNDKINAATEGLYARRQMSTPDKDGKYENIWQDDIVQRCAAIDRLEGLAEENPSEVPRIARLLSVYVRELSDEVKAAHPPENATPDELNTWIKALPKLRSDMEKAAQTLGRLSDIALIPLENGEIDLRGSNLQNADLAGLKFNKARFGGAQLQGADLSGAQLQGAYLIEAQLQGADLVGASMDSDTSLIAATLRGAAIKDVDFTNVPQIVKHLDDMFGDASVALQDGITKPDHWPNENLVWGEFTSQWRDWQATLPPGWDAPDL